MKHELLDWDSKFFGFKVARISHSEINEFELIGMLKLLKQKGFTLVYVSTPVKLDNLLLNNFGIMVDVKVTYLKRIDVNSTIDCNIINFNLKYPTEQMLKLAIESGTYSRFNKDKKIGRNKFEELYKLWMINSVNHSIAESVLVYKEMQDVIGIITLSEKNGRGDVGIIAVDPKARGKGVGTKLMKSAEKWSYDKSYKNIQIVTQGSNNIACGLYEKLGYSKDKVEYIYHYWLKNI